MYKRAFVNRPYPSPLHMLMPRLAAAIQAILHHNPINLSWQIISFYHHYEKPHPHARGASQICSGRYTSTSRYAKQIRGMPSLKYLYYPPAPSRAIEVVEYLAEISLRATGEMCAFF